MPTAIHPTRRRGLLVCVALAGVTVLGACSDDESGGETSAAPSTSGVEQRSTDEFCAVAEEIAALEGAPTAELSSRYADLAPEGARADAELVAEVAAEHDGDSVALIAAFADDELDEAFRRLTAVETDTCGMEPPDGPAEAMEVDPAANRVDIVAVDYAFEGPSTVAAGPTSFVLRNDGDEAHFLLVAQIADGHTMEEALSYEGDPAEAGLITGVEVESDLAAPGGDEEVANLDLEPGTYAMLCFIPAADGTPHAFMGMASELIVT